MSVCLEKDGADYILKVQDRYDIAYDAYSFSKEQVQNEAVAIYVQDMQDIPEDKQSAVKAAICQYINDYAEDSFDDLIQTYGQEIAQSLYDSYGSEV